MTLHTEDFNFISASGEGISYFVNGFPVETWKATDKFYAWQGVCDDNPFRSRFASNACVLKNSSNSDRKYWRAFVAYY